ncbi:hypothetical protein [Vibrio owensii]|uniref:hypothetical protein n=1 Tax=Vibrio owensii TaxID=696485 RepID=UPI000597DF78|nr:hypothetical protein [Vibrio owensii]
MSRVDRFKKRKSLLTNLHSKPDIRLAPTDAELAEFLDSEVDTKFVESQRMQSDTFFNNEYDLDVSHSEVQSYLNAIESQFTIQKYDVLFESTREVLIDQLLKPFHLSRADIAKTDRDFSYNREDYTRSGKSVGGENKSFDSVRKDAKELATNDVGQIQDANTGVWHAASEMDYDHIKPLKNAHDSGGFMLSDSEKSALGTDTDNLIFTHQSINRSKGSKTQNEFVEESDNQSLDGRRTKPAHERGEKAVGKYIPRDNIDKTAWVAKRGLEDGVKTGKDQGLQQALSVCLSELISALFDEIKDCLANGFNPKDSSSWLESLKIRFKRVAIRVSGKWSNVLEAFGQGFLTGLISGVVTALINLVARTGKEIVRLIREGFMSLMKALKTLLFPPEGMTLKQAAHEASKVLATGVVTSGVILLSEILHTHIASFAPFLSAIPFSGVIYSVLTGMLAGVSSLIVVYMLDKLDLFGVNAEERASFIQGKIESDFDNNYSEAENIIARMGIVSLT